MAICPTAAFPDRRQLITEPPPCLRHGQNSTGENSNYTLYNIFTHLLLLLAPLGVLDISRCHCRDPQPFLQFPLHVDHFLECNKLCCQVSILLMPDIRKVQIFYLFWLGAKIFQSPVTEDLVIQACNSNIPREIVRV